MLTWFLIAGSAALLAGSITLGCIVLHRWLRARLVPTPEPGTAVRPSRALPIVSGWLARVNRPLLRPRYESAIRRRLVQAGEPRDLEPVHLLALQEVGFLCGLALGWVAVDRLKVHPATSLAFALLGGCAPLFWLRDQVKKRLLRIGRALPYHLDLLTLAVEAGLDFTGALGKVVERGRAGPLRDELQLVLKQLRVGKTREEALREMIARVDLPQLTQFVRVLIQADKMGTSLGKVLRIQSGQMRAERTQRAEKLANQAPVKMLAPLVGCIFPTVFMILFGPIVFALMFGG